MNSMDIHDNPYSYICNFAEELYPKIGNVREDDRLKMKKLNIRGIIPPQEEKDSKNARC